MSLSIAIVGLPNVGKSTLFQALTKKQVDIANYPFCTIDPNVGVVEVPDERLQKLAAFSRSQKIIPAVVEFVDIAGLVRGANKGEGLGNQFLAHIRETDAVLYVVRLFEDENVHHVEHTIDPLRDIEIVQTELALKDLETVEKRLDSARKELKGAVAQQEKDIRAEIALLEQLNEALNRGVGARAAIVRQGGGEEQLHIIRPMQLLTAKPVLFALNVYTLENIPQNVLDYVAKSNSSWIAANFKEELESAGFSQSERKELGLAPSRLPLLIAAAYEALGLITFLTTGEKESRAWTIKKGMTAPQAAGVIHTDFEKNFIRAEVINWQELLNAGGWVPLEAGRPKAAEAASPPSGGEGRSLTGWAEARAKGTLRLEGKEYVVQDGDVIVVRHGA